MGERVPTFQTTRTEVSEVDLQVSDWPDRGHESTLSNYCYQRIQLTDRLEPTSQGHPWGWCRAGVTNGSWWAEHHPHIYFVRAAQCFTIFYLNTIV